jgi:hypothetical protein
VGAMSVSLHHQSNKSFINHLTFLIMYTVEIKPKENVRSITAKKTEFSNKRDFLSYLYEVVASHSILPSDYDEDFIERSETEDTCEDFGDVFISVTHS